MVVRKIKGIFLGVPILSEGSDTEDDRLRRDGFGYATLSLVNYFAEDYVTSSILLFLCLCATIYMNVANKISFWFRLTLHIAFSITYLVAILRSDVVSLAPPFVLGLLTYYGLMYFICFDR